MKQAFLFLRKISHALNNFPENVTRPLQVLTRINFLRDRATHSIDQGITNEKYCNPQIIVSLTTYGKRIYDVSLAIESIMQGSLLPNKIVLWLSEKEFKGRPLPRLIINQQRRGLEVRYCEDIFSYKKLIPSLIEFPNDVIITIDDDLIYHYNMVEKLVYAYIASPNFIHANRIHNMLFLKTGLPQKYVQWEYQIGNTEISSPSFFFTTGGGVLFPPNSLDKEVFNKKVYLNLCRYGDDIWFNTMAIKKGTRIKKTYTESPCGSEFFYIPNNKEPGLYIKNICDSQNDIQINAVFKYYGIPEILHRHNEK